MDDASPNEGSFGHLVVRSRMPSACIDRFIHPSAWNMNSAKFVVTAFSGVGFRKWQGPLRYQWPLPSPFLDVKAKLPGELSRLRRGYHEGKTSPANHDARAHQPVHHPHPYRPSERLQVVVDAHLIYEVVPRHTHGQKPEQAHLKPNIGQVVGDYVAHPELVEKQECREGDDELVAQAEYLQRRPLSTIPYSPNLLEGEFSEVRPNGVLRSTRQVLASGIISTVERLAPAKVARVCRRCSAVYARLSVAGRHRRNDGLGADARFSQGPARSRRVGTRGRERQGDASTILAGNCRDAPVPDRPLPLSRADVVDPLAASLGNEVRFSSSQQCEGRAQQLPFFVSPLFTGVRGIGILGSSLPASNAQVTAKIAHLSDTPAPPNPYPVPLNRRTQGKGTPWQAQQTSRTVQSFTRRCVSATCTCA